MKEELQGVEISIIKSEHEGLLSGFRAIPRSESRAANTRLSIPQGTLGTASPCHLPIATVMLAFATKILADIALLT